MPSPTVRNPASPPRSPARRWWMALCGLAVSGLFGCVVWKLHDLQVVKHDGYAEDVEQTLNGVQRIAPHRGNIVDSHGRPLAISVESMSCGLDPERLKATPGATLAEVVGHLADLIGLTRAEIQGIIEKAEPDRRKVKVNGVEVERPNKFVWVRRHLDPAVRERLEEASREYTREAAAARREAAQLRRQAVQPSTSPEDRADLLRQREDLLAEARLHDAALAGLVWMAEERRQYPQGSLGGHVLGFTDDYGHGLEGVEKRMNAHLTGMAAEYPVLRDARSVRLDADDLELPAETSGLTVMLTLDAVIQLIAEEELARVVGELIQEHPGITASAIVVDPWTGDLLAMANYPDFDPNAPAAGPAGNRLNRAVASAQEPGSIMKPFPFAVALEEKLVNPDEIFDCSPYRMANGRWIRDINSFTRPLQAREILINSSNPGIVQVAERVGKEKLHRYYLDYGFGKRSAPQLLSGELPGHVYPLRKWSSYSMGSVPMGYEIMVTPLQMAMAYCIFANGGWLPEPRLVKQVNDPDGHPRQFIPPRMRRQVLSAETCQTIRDIMREVVMRGTGQHANLRDYAIAGKTGTANLMANEEERRQGIKPYSKTRHTANFVGIAPYENPRLVVSVTIRESTKYGGRLSAPVAARIIQRTLSYLGVPLSDPMPTYAMSPRRPADLP